MEKISGRVFVGGLCRETSEATLMEYFSNFGEIDDCFILIDTTTGCSRGYGFVNFTEPAMADQVLDQQDHYILGRKVDVKSATQRGQSNQTQEHDSNGNGKKIFVGGLPNGLTTYQLRTHFETFGPVDDAVIMHNSSGNPRGFGFVTFSSAPDAEKALQQRFHALSHKTVEVKRAEPREKISYGQPEVHDSYPTAFPSADPYYGYSPYGYYYDPCYGVYWSPYGYYGDYGYGYLVVPANGMGDLSFSAQHIPTENGDCGSSEYDGSTDGVASVSDAALRFDSLMM